MWGRVSDPSKRSEAPQSGLVQNLTTEPQRHRGENQIENSGARAIAPFFVLFEAKRGALQRHVVRPFYLVILSGA
jgi:hypothetical protein